MVLHHSLGHWDRAEKWVRGVGRVAALCVYLASHFANVNPYLKVYFIFMLILHGLS